MAGRKTLRTRTISWFQNWERRLVNAPKKVLDSIYIVAYAIREFRRDLGLERAATLSFATLLSLIPLTVLFFSFAGALGGGDKISEYIEDKVFEFVAPEFHQEIREWLDGNISREAFSAPPADSAAEEPGAEPSTDENAELSEKPETDAPIPVDPELPAAPERDAFQASPSGVVNSAAIAALLIAALGMLTAAERIFNVIWKVKGTRGYIKRLAAFWLILTTSPFLIAASISISDILVPQGGWLESAIEDYWIIQQLYGFVVPFLISWVGFSTIYLALPATQVRIRSAFCGGFVGSLLWSLSKIGFLVYVERSTTAANFYGKLAAIPLFLVWIYLSWGVTIFGAEVSYTHQNLATLRRASRAPDRKRSRLLIGLELLTRVDTGQHRGLPPQTTREVASALSIRNEDVEEVAQFLVSRGLLVEDAAIPDRFVLGRSADVIRLDDLATLLVDSRYPGEIQGSLEADLDDGDFTPGSRANAEAWCRAIHGFEDKTVADLRSEEADWMEKSASVVEPEEEGSSAKSL